MTHPYLNDIRLAQARMEALLEDAGVIIRNPAASWPGLPPSNWRLHAPMAGNPPRGQAQRGLK